MNTFPGTPRQRTFFQNPKTPISTQKHNPENLQKPRSSLHTFLPGCTSSATSVRPLAPFMPHLGQTSLSLSQLRCSTALFFYFPNLPFFLYLLPYLRAASRSVARALPWRGWSKRGCCPHFVRLEHAPSEREYNWNVATACRARITLCATSVLQVYGMLLHEDLYIRSVVRWRFGWVFCRCCCCRKSR